MYLQNNHMIKICHIITSFDADGAEMMLYKLLSGTDRHKFEPIVISLADYGMLGDKTKALGIKVYSIGMKSGFPSPNKLLSLISLVRKLSPDIIQGWMYHGNLAAQLVGTFTSKKVHILWNIRHSLYSLSHEKKGTAMMIKIGKYLSHLPEYIIFNAKISARQHKDFGYCDTNCIVIPNGFETNIFKPISEAYTEVRTELNLPVNTFLIGLIARYHPMKDHDNFLKAASLFSAIYSDVHFMLVGKDIDQNNTELVQKINHLGLSKKVHLLGERRNLPRLISALDIFSLTSYTEAFPNVIGEAMACEVPCAVTDVGDSSWIVGETGKVVKPQDPVALSNAWKDLYEINKEERHKLGILARERIIENFTLNNIIKEYEQIYLKISKKGIENMKD